MAERLQKFLSRAGVASRRKAETLIAAGAVTVNGVRAELGQSVTQGDDVRVNGVRATVQEHVTYMLYKPAGVLSSVSDDRGRETVIDLLPPVPGLHPVGRLDLESEGLLLVTNDGDLTLRLTHPRYGHEKAYRVWCDAPLSRTDLQRLKNGLELDDGPAEAASVRAMPGGCELTLREGRNRQVRRMLGALGRSVTRLLRTRVAHLSLAGLEPGAYRQLTEAELEPLMIRPILNDMETKRE